MKKNQSNLPAVIESGMSFDLTVADGIDIDPDIAALIDDEDTKMYEAGRDSLTFVSIRQKDKKDEKGKLLYPAGGFAMNIEGVADIKGDEGLIVTVMADLTSRVYFKELTDKKPTCKSHDGNVGIGSPGGHCSTCPLNQWKDDKRPDCSQNINLFCYDHRAESPYVLTLGRSGLKPYSDFKNFVKRQVVQVGNVKRPIPLHFCAVKVTAEYKADPSPHYVPAFEIISALSADSINQVKSFRAEYASLFSKAVETTEVSDGDAPNVEDAEYSELPEGVTDLRDDNEDIPFI